MRALMVILIVALGLSGPLRCELPLIPPTMLLRLSTQSKKPEPGQESRNEELQFKDMGGGDAVRNGVPLSIHWWQSSDGVPITSYIESYPSADKAKRAMQKKVKSDEVISRGAKLNRSGKRVGERAVIRLLGRGRHPGAAILWTDASELHYLESPSLRHVLAFEGSLLDH